LARLPEPPLPLREASSTSLLKCSFDRRPRVFVEVQDTGPGLDPKKPDRLFQSFYTTKPDEIGLDLAISRSIPEAMAGA
jgi:signal transduction histidine kinase